MRVLFAFVLFSMCAGSALAEGTYVRADLGRAELDFDSFDSANNEAFGIGIGQKIVDNLSAELGYRKLGDFSLEPQLSTIALTTVGKVNVDLFEAGLNYRMTLDTVYPSIYLEGRLGVALYDVRTTIAGSALAVLNPAFLLNPANGCIRDSSSFSCPSQNLKENGNKIYFGLGGGVRMNEQLDIGLAITQYQMTANLIPQLGGEEREFNMPTVTVNATWNF